MRFKQSELKTVVAALALIVVGILLLIAGAHQPDGWLGSLLYNVGSFIIASVVLALVWQFWQVRGFLDDMFNEARIAENVRRARITNFFTNFYDPVVPWSELFAGCKRLDIFFAYASTWRISHRPDLESFLTDGDAALNVVLPNPDHDVVMAELALRFGYSPEDIRGKVLEARQYFEELGANGAGHVRVYYLNRSMTFTFYRFSSAAVFTTYRHRLGRGPIVTFVCEREGELYKWIREVWYGVVEAGTAAGITRLAYDSASKIATAGAAKV